MRKIAPALSMIVLLAGASLGCIDRAGQLSLYLSGSSTLGDAAAATGAQQVNVEVIEVALRQADSGAFLTLAAGSQVYELIGLEGRLSLLALADDLEPGSYNAVRLTFAENNSSVVTDAGRKTQLSIEPSTVLVPVLAQVQDDAHSTVEIEFDVAASVTRKGNGSWVLRPVLRYSAE